MIPYSISEAILHVVGAIGWHLAEFCIGFLEGLEVWR